jgi:cell division protein FtsL
MGGVRRNLRSPAQRRKQLDQGPSLISFFFWTFFLVSAAISYLWIYNQNDVAANDLAEKQIQIQELTNTSQELEITIDRLSQIDRITNIARSQLGMIVPPAESLVVYITKVGL